MTTQVNDFKEFLKDELKKGLVDVKFCVVNNASSDTSVEKASGVIMMATQQYNNNETKEFTDY